VVLMWFSGGCAMVEPSLHHMDTVVDQ